MAQENEKVITGQMVFDNTETSVLTFETFLRSQGIFLAKANAEEIEILKMTFGYAYKEYCQRNNFIVEALFDKP